MYIIPLGKIVVPTPGTPVALTATAALLAFKVHKIVIVQLPTPTTGKVYFGINTITPDGATVTFSKSTGAGVLHAFVPAGTAGLLDEHCVCAPGGQGNVLNLGDFLVDVDSANDGLYAYAERV